MVASSAEQELRVNVCFLGQAAQIYGQDAPNYSQDAQDYDQGAAGDDLPPGFAPATATAVGIDLRACFEDDEISLSPGARAAIPAGVAIEPVVPGIAGFVYSRSGLGAKHGLVVAQGVGVIDPDYRGEIMVWLLNTSQQTMTVRQGERIAQLAFQPYVRPLLRRKAQLSQTARGAGGFGHTGQF